MEERVFNHSAHIALWDWLANNPFCSKEDWPGWKQSNDIAKNCFACEFTWDSDFMFCNLCPLVWPSESAKCLGDNSLFEEWEGTGFDEEGGRSYLASIIRDIPVRPGVKCI